MNDLAVLDSHNLLEILTLTLKFHKITEGKCIFENKPPPQSSSCLLLKKGGLIFGRIRYTQTNMKDGGSLELVLACTVVFDE